jgi:hypothetical protein
MSRKQRRQLEHVARKLSDKPLTLLAPPVANSRPPIQQIRPLQLAARKVYWAIGALATLTTIASGFLALRYNVSIEPYVLRDPTIPFSQRFSIQNTGWFPIYEVLPYCHIAHAQMDGKVDARGPYPWLGVYSPTDLVPELDGGAKITTLCHFWDEDKEHSWKDLLISIVVRYKVPLGFRRCKAVKFKALSAPNDTYIWVYDGSESCPSWTDLDYPPSPPPPSPKESK